MRSLYVFALQWVKICSKRPQIQDGMTALNKSAWISFFLFSFDLCLFFAKWGKDELHQSNACDREKVALKIFAPWKYEDKDQDLSKTVHVPND